MKSLAIRRFLESIKELSTAQIKSANYNSYPAEGQLQTHNCPLGLHPRNTKRPWGTI